MVESYSTPGVIFDLDGVLVDSGELHYLAWRRFGRELGAEMNRDFFLSTFGMDNRRIIPRWLDRRFTEEELRRLSERKENHFQEEARRKLEPLAGAIELVTALAGEGFRLAIGTSAPQQTVEIAFARTGLEKYFMAVVCGDEVAEGKPAPGIFRRAAEKIGCPPAACVVVEDAIPGVEAARRAGMKCVAVATTHPRASLAAADRVVNSLAELRTADFRCLLCDQTAVPGQNAEVKNPKKC